DNSSKKLAKNKPNPFWKFFWLTFLVLSLVYAWYSFYAPSNEIKWKHNITSIAQIKNISDKNVLLFFTGKWCSPCRIMKREVFADEEIEKLVNNNVIPITIDIDNPNSKEVVQYFKVGATPTTIIVDSEGKLLDYAVGKIDKNNFFEMLSNIEPN
ncbi:MAG: thioredoxin family protein, partial [Chitinophagales bacterium]|nr:thioredoxin family protein [Chitinophagales bacterium]